MTEQLHFQLAILSADIESRNFLAKSYGKKSTSSDISLYTMLSDGVMQTTIIPEAYPKKPLPLVYTAHMADLAVLAVSTKGIDGNVGESALLIDCLNINGIKAIIGTDAAGYDIYFDQMKKIFSKLSVSKWSNKLVSTGKEASELKEELIKMHPGPRGRQDDYLAIEVDHAFPVHGVGSVILGTVISGTVQKGQAVKIFPGNVKGSVRSIQVNDVDVKVAEPGTHVGLALKGVLPKYLSRGTVITDANDDNISEIKSIDMEINRAKFGKDPKNGDKIHVVAGLFTSPAEITEWNKTSISISLEKPIPEHKLERITILDLNKKPSVIGSRK